MKFVKKLFIMTGRGGAKGAVVAEHNAYGSFAQVSASGLDYSRGHRYFVFISDAVLVFPMTAGGKYNLGGAALMPAHVAVVTAGAKGLDVELYGTDGEKRMWQSNLCDMVRGKINGFESQKTLDIGAQESAGEKAGEEKILSLFPVGGEYDDGAIAKVNYYSNIYSSRKGAAPSLDGDQARLAELGGSLLSSRLELDEDESMNLPLLSTDGAQKETDGAAAEKEARAENGALLSDSEKSAEKAFEKSSDSEESSALGETAAAVSAAPSYAKFLYGYRDEILRRGAGVYTPPRNADETPLKINPVRAMSEESAGIKEDIPQAPKTDIAASERALKEAAAPKLNFYERNKQKLDSLIEDNPREEAIEKLLPSSRFVRINIENSDKYYCVGLIGKPDYICYAVPSRYTPEPPEELDGYCQWLPLDEKQPTSDGYWLIYQDAVTGDSIEGE